MKRKKNAKAPHPITPLLDKIDNGLFKISMKITYMEKKINNIERKIDELMIGLEKLLVLLEKQNKYLIELNENKKSSIWRELKRYLAIR